MNQMIAEIERLVIPLLENEGIELVDITYQKGVGGWALCFYLDKPGGISLADCESWSRKLEEVVEGSDLIDRSYSLEVSSPGINRPLKKDSDFDRFTGQRVSVKLFAPIENQKNFHGILKGRQGNTIVVEQEDGTTRELPMEKIAKAKLDPILKI